MIINKLILIIIIVIIFIVIEVSVWELVVMPLFCVFIDSVDVDFVCVVVTV